MPAMIPADPNNLYPATFFTKKLTRCPCGCGLDIKPHFRRKLNILISMYGRRVRFLVGARCAGYNNRVGGGIYDSNIKGLGADFEINSDTERHQFIKYALFLDLSIQLKGSLLRVEFHPGFPTVILMPARARRPRRDKK